MYQIPQVKPDPDGGAGLDPSQKRKREAEEIPTNAEYIMTELKKAKMSSSPIHRLLPPNVILPDVYEIALKEVNEVVHDLFLADKTVDDDIKLDLVTESLQFLEVYSEVFDNDSPSTEMNLSQELFPDLSSAPVVNKSMKRFREYYRRRFRGVACVQSKILTETQQLAFRDTEQFLVKLFDTGIKEYRSDNTGNPLDKATTVEHLKGRMRKEHSWIEKINSFKKGKILQTVKLEIWNNFWETVRSEYPFDPANSMLFYEEDKFRSYTTELVTRAVEDLKEQIPFADDKDTLGIQLQSELMETLDKYISINRTLKDHAEVHLDKVLKEGVEYYSHHMAAFFEKLLYLDSQCIQQQHSQLKSACFETFESNIEPSVPLKYRQEYVDKFDCVIGEEFRNALQAAQLDAESRAELCYQKSKDELNKFMSTVKGHFKKVTEHDQYADRLKRKVEKCLEEAVEELKGYTIANKRNVEALLGTPTNCLVYTDDERLKKEEILQESILKLTATFIEKIESARTQDGPQPDSGSIRKSMKNLLILKIKQELGEDEPVEKYTKILEEHMNQYVFSRIVNTIEKIDKKLEERFCRDEQTPKSINVAPTVPNPAFKLRPKTHVLPPLVFQLSLNRVITGALVDGNPKILRNDAGELFTPAVIGLTKKGEFVHGSHTSRETCIDKLWFIGKYFIAGKTAYSDDVLLLGKIRKITVELLLGMLLKRLKDNAECNMGGGICLDAVITVPCWFTSTHRIQVKDAARIAGFVRVFLVNESSAAAYAFMSAGIISSSRATGNLLVMSENSGKVDVAVYSLNNGDPKHVQMISHRGSYLLNTKNELESVLPTKVEVQQASTLVHSTCLEVLQIALQQQYSKKLPSVPNESLVVITESSDWRPVLEKVGSVFLKRPHGYERGSQEDEAVIMGAVLLSTHPTRIGFCVRDKLACMPFRSCEPLARIAKLSVNSLPFETSDKLVNVCVPKGMKEIMFYQELNGSKIPIGELKMLTGFQADDQLKATLTVNSEGILKFQYVMVGTRHRKKGNKDSSEATTTWKTLPINDHRISLVTPNLHDNYISESSEFVRLLKE